MKKYIKPEMEIMEFDYEDIITSSGDTSTEDEYGGTEDD